MTRSDRVYRSRSNVGAGVIWIALSNILAIGVIVREPNNLLLVVLAGVYSVVATIFFVRLIWAGIFVLEGRVHVANILSSFDVDPSEIDGIEIARWKLIPRTCVIRTHDGQVRPAFGLQESTNFPNGSAERLIDELRQELGGMALGSQGMQAV